MPESKRLFCVDVFPYVDLPLDVSIFNREKNLCLQNQEQFAFFFFNPWYGVKAETNIPQLLQGRMPLLEVWYQMITRIVMMMWDIEVWMRNMVMGMRNMMMGMRTMRKAHSQP